MARAVLTEAAHASRCGTVTKLVASAKSGLGLFRFRFPGTAVPGSQIPPLRGWGFCWRKSASVYGLIVDHDVGLPGGCVLLLQHACDVPERYMVRQGLEFPKRYLALSVVKIGVLQKVLLLRHEMLRSVFGVACHLNRTGQHCSAH
jgi:hypothetical protein